MRPLADLLADVQNAAAAAQGAIPAAVEPAVPAEAKAAMPPPEVPEVGGPEGGNSPVTPVEAFAHASPNQELPVEPVAGGPLPGPEGADAAGVIEQGEQLPDVAGGAAPKAAEGVQNVPVAVPKAAEAIPKAADVAIPKAADVAPVAGAVPKAADVAPVPAKAVPPAAEVVPKAEAAVAAPKPGGVHPTTAPKRRGKKSPEIPGSWKR